MQSLMRLPWGSLNNPSQVQRKEQRGKQRSCGGGPPSTAQPAPAARGAAGQDGGGPAAAEPARRVQGAGWLQEPTRTVTSEW